MITIQLSDYGQDLTLRVLNEGTLTAVDISAATTLQIIATKPSGTVLTWTASFSTNGTDGKLKYLIPAGVINETGRWTCQGRVVTASSEWRTSVTKFRVAANL